MRTVRAFEVISFLAPLVLFACGGEKNREAESPSNTASYEAPNPEPARSQPATEPSGMTPASRMADETERDKARADQSEPSTDATKSSSLSDQQIVAITDAANSSEVDAAKYVLTKTKNQRVRKFAQMMVDQHGKAKQDQSKLVSKLGISPEESTKLKDLKTGAADTDRTLKAAPDDMFDKVYIDIQVADHQMVLDSLDREFIPNAQNAELKKSLQDFRPKVQQHLNQALEIQKALMSSSPTKSGGTDSKSNGGTQESDKTRGNPSGFANGTGGPQSK